MLKIGSVFVAALLWMVVFNSTDPIEKKTIVLELQYLNQDTLLNENLVLSEAPKTTEIWVQAQRSKLASITNEDFVATIDLSSRIGSLEDKKTVEINVTAKKNIEWGFSSTSSRYPQIVLDNIIEKEMELIVVQEGELQEGYQLEQELLIPNPSTITVRGPEKQFSNVASAKVVIDLSQLSDEVSQLEVEPVLCDSNGEEISITKKNLTISPETVIISTGVLATKKVPIILEGITGEVDDNYTLKNITLNLEEVYIGGTKEQINQIEQIVIPKTFVNVEGIENNKSFYYDLKQFCTENNVTLLNKDSKIEIKIEVEQLQQKKFQISTSNIQLDGKNSEYTYTYNSNNVLVTLKGIASELSNFNGNDIILKGSVNNLGVGTHTISLQVLVKDTLQLVQEVSVDVTINEKKQENNQNNNQNNESSLGESSSDVTTTDSQESTTIENEESSTVESDIETETMSMNTEANTHN